MHILLLLIEAIWENAYWLGAGILGTLLTAAALAGAIKALRKEWFSPIFTRLRARAARRATQTALAGDMKLVKDTLQVISAELKTNGGNSLKDLVLKIERKTTYIQARTRHQDETSEHAIFELDETGDMTFANCTFCELLEADEKDLLFRNFISRVHQDDKARLLAELKQALAERMNLDTIVYFNVSPVQKRKVHLRAAPAFRADGQIIGWFGRAEVLGSL